MLGITFKVALIARGRIIPWNQCHLADLAVDYRMLPTVWCPTKIAAQPAPFWAVAV